MSFSTGSLGRGDIYPGHQLLTDLHRDPVSFQQHDSQNKRGVVSAMQRRIVARGEVYQRALIETYVPPSARRMISGSPLRLAERLLPNYSPKLLDLMDATGESDSAASGTFPLRFQYATIADMLQIISILCFINNGGPVFHHENQSEEIIHNGGERSFADLVSRNRTFFESTGLAVTIGGVSSWNIGLLRGGQAVVLNHPEETTAIDLTTLDSGDHTRDLVRHGLMVDIDPAGEGTTPLLSFRNQRDTQLARMLNFLTAIEFIK